MGEMVPALAGGGEICNARRAAKKVKEEWRWRRDGFCCKVTEVSIESRI